MSNENGLKSSNGINTYSYTVNKFSCDNNLTP